MAVQVQDFVIPEHNYGGLHKAANTVERKNEREQELQRQQTARKGASATFLTNYLDPKDRLTGTNYDPEIVKGFDDLLQEGIKLVNTGADTNMVMMALAPKVSKLNEYSTKAKLVNQRLKEQLAQIPANSGYDKGRLEQQARQAAFMDDKGQLKEIDTVDPEVDYITETIKKYPDRVTTDIGIDEFVRTSPKFTNTDIVKRTNSKGGYERKKTKVTAPAWMIVDDEGELVPRYEIALENGQPQTYEFTTTDGKTKNAPIRLMDEKDFNSILSGNPAIADWVRGQVIKANPGIDINSPQAKNAARAIMYDELKRRKPGGMEDVEEVKANPVKVYTGGGSKPSKKEIEANTPINLSQYGTKGDYYNVTKLAPGIKVTGLPTGQTYAATEILFNPDTKEVEYTDVQGNKEKVDFDTFRQNIATINTGVDLSFIDRLKVTGRPDGNKQQTPPAKKEIKRSDISAKAKAAGYSTSEYEALLKKNGVTIKD